MLKRISVVRNIEWKCEDSRKLSKTEREDFLGKCQILFPAFVDFLKERRADDDESHDVLRRRLYDAINFRVTDSENFVKNVLGAVARRAFIQKIMPGLGEFEQYFDILSAAYKEARRAKIIHNQKPK